jgi:hypothetical protein
MLQKWARRALSEMSAGGARFGRLQRAFGSIHKRWDQGGAASFLNDAVITDYIRQNSSDALA